ncbi:hypothetical protein HY639_01085 [Candidatus Woesearchaeota archaeon]|nr:hypothetical protein [Candidatus Woesearchaeota archaeon]
MVRILVGCPTYDGKAYCLAAYIVSLRKLTSPHCSFLLVDNSATNEYAAAIAQYGIPVQKIPFIPDPRDRVTESRNVLRAAFLAGDYDYLFSLEQDIIPEPGIIGKMLAQKKDIIAAPYCVYHIIDGKQMLVPVAYDKHPSFPGGLWYLSREELKKPQLRPVMAFGLGCVLIHRPVLEKVRFRHAHGYDDMMFCKDAREAGFDLNLDTTLKVTHLLPGGVSIVV